MDERTTVLVGRNGAGKSLVADAIVQGAMQATQIFVSHSFLTVGSFRCEIWRPEAPALGYEYRCQRASGVRGFEDARKKLIELYLHDYGTLSDYLYKQSED